MEFPLSLALLDYVPVLLTGIGFAYIIRLVLLILPSQGRIALVGGMLVVAGGFFRATWKLLLALSTGSLDVRWMGESLFILMAPGYVMFAWSVWQVARAVQGKRIFHASMVPFLLSVVTLGTSYSLYLSRPDSSAWERVLLSVTVLATLLSGVLLIAFAFRQRLSTAGWLFIVNLIGVFVMNGLARLPEQPVTIHWVAEGINTISWLAFVIAAWMLYQYARINLGLDAAEDWRLALTAKSGR